MAKKQISNSKNTITDAHINAGGNIHIGDIININQKENEAPGVEKITPEIAKNIRNLIGKNKVKQALETLLKHAELMDEDLHNQVLQQSQRWNELKKKESLNVISHENAEIVRNRIVYALLGIVNELEG